MQKKSVPLEARHTAPGLLGGITPALIYSAPWQHLLNRNTWRSHVTKNNESEIGGIFVGCKKVNANW